MMRRSFLAGIVLAAGLGAAVPAAADAIEIVDIAGRRVTLEKPADRILLGEGRFLVALSLLTPESPVARVAGMLNDFRLYDPTGFARYAAAFPEVESIPWFGQTTEQSVSLEKAIALHPDAAVFGLSGHGPQRDSETMIRTLEAAGIPVVFIDFRDDPLGNTARSMRILGRVLGLDAAAESFAADYGREVDRIVDRVATLPDERPNVFLEVRVDLDRECCLTIARGMFADLIAAAGGASIARDRLPGAAGLVSLEFVIGAAPDHYIGTAVGSLSGSMTGSGRIILGAGVDEATARASLAAVLERPGFSTLTAIGQGRAHAIWHHFYNSPLNVYALQVFAKWLHPDVFRDVDPEATLAALLARIRPVDLGGIYATSLTAPAR